MVSLILACAAFVGIHVFVSGTSLRDVLTARMGEKAYMGAFSIASFAALAWIVLAYMDAPYLELWAPSPGLRHATLLLVFIGFMFIVIGQSTPNPTATGQAGALKQEHAARGIVRITRHPFLWGIVLWAAGHMLINGDVAALVLFVSMLALGLIGPFLIDAKRARRDPEGWARFAAETSWLPFAAIVQGRTQLSLSEIGWWRPLAAIAVYLVFVLWLHQWLFGVAPLPA
jgi:uncharacterized membrane protein